MYTFSTLSSLSPFLLTTYFFFFLFRYPPSSTLFPYTTLFRSVHQGTDNSHGDRTNSQVGFLSDRCEGKPGFDEAKQLFLDRKSTRLNSSHVAISYAVFCLKKKKLKDMFNIILICTDSKHRYGH